MEFKKSRLRAGIEAPAARRDHDVLDEHAVVEPAAPLEDAVDGEHQTDRRVEEAVIAPMLMVSLLEITFADAEQPIHVPAYLAAPIDIGRGPLLRVIGVFALVGGGHRRIVEGGQNLAAELGTRLAGHHIDFPGLGVGTRRRARRDLKNLVDGLARDFTRQKSANRLTGEQRLIGAAAGLMTGTGIKFHGWDADGKVGGKPG